MNTYITAAEAPNYFSEFTEYSSGVANAALRDSFGLVNAYLAPKIRPQLTAVWDGDSFEIPSILKVCQGQFLSYLLQISNVGYREDLALQYDATVAVLKGLTEGELNLDGVPSEGSVGWTIYANSTASGILYIASPRRYGAIYPTTIRIEIDSVASGLAVGAATFKYGYPLLGSSWESEGLATTKPSDALTIGYENLSIGFMGTFNPGDYWLVAGYPKTDVEQPIKLTTLVQRGLSL